jgi:hypothetical protein
MAIEHINITDPNVHSPKGFAAASPSTYLKKDAAGTDVEWVPITKAYGCVYANSVATTGVDGTFRAINDASIGGTLVWQDQNTQGITFNTTSGFYEADEAGDYEVNVTLSISPAVSSSNEFQFTVGVDTSPAYTGPVEKSSIATAYTTLVSTEKKSSTLVCLPTLAAGDRLYLMVRRNSGTNQLVLDHANYIIVKVS